MYAPSYAFGPGNNAQAFNPNGAHPQAPQTPLQPGQQPQHMMYNPQQYAVAGHPSPYGASPGPGMGGNAGGMAMMPNTGMAHMPGGNVPSYQTPYTSSPYGSNLPTSSSVSHPQNFMPTTSNAPSQYGMNPSSMLPQQHQMQQRMQPPPSSTPMPTSATSRVSPYGNFPQNSPPTASPAQFAMPQNPNHQLQQQQQTPNSNPQSQGGMSLTPQTPNFPPGAQNPENAGVPLATPLSPGSEHREKERVSVLLEINREMLFEVVRIQGLQAKAKSNPPQDPAERAKLEQDMKAATKEYVECMRRLQYNLAYLAAIADRSHKPASQVPSHPAVMSAPFIAPAPKSIKSSEPASTNGDGSPAPASEETQEDRARIISDLYKRLQDLFPGVDPKRDVAPQQPNAAARAQQQHAQQMQAHKQGDMGQGQGQATADDEYGADAGEMIGWCLMVWMEWVSESLVG
ncbi:glutamine repeat -1 protein [Rutstroemia sp. NJR-2017a WRK4]|nr:glutamine repeat -1 protein [Rutstroemia sp. NJR-2017a WRK4]